MHFYSSFADPDAPYAGAINNMLRDAGHRVNFTPRSGEYCGADWMERIQRTDRFLLTFSPAALETGLCKAEWQYALASNLAMFIVVRAGSLPPELEARPHVDATGAENPHLLEILLAQE